MFSLPSLTQLFFGEKICSSSLAFQNVQGCPFCWEYLPSLLRKEGLCPLYFKLQGDTAIISEPAASQALYPYNHI